MFSNVEYHISSIFKSRREETVMWQWRHWHIIGFLSRSGMDIVHIGTRVVTQVMIQSTSHKNDFLHLYPWGNIRKCVLPSQYQVREGSALCGFFMKIERKSGAYTLVCEHFKRIFPKRLPINRGYARSLLDSISTNTAMSRCLFHSVQFYRYTFYISPN